MRIISKNKYALLNYEIEERYEAGIILNGFETKSIKTGNINIKEAIVKVYGNGEIYITNMNIPLYSKTSIKMVPWYDPKKTRKLLLHKKEIQKLGERTNKTGLTIIPLSIYETKKRLIKIEIGLGKLRKKVEKKQIIKEREINRQAQKEMRHIIK